MSQKSMKLPKLYRIIVDVQFGDMLDECNKLYDGEGYGTVFTDANGDAVIDYLKQWDSDEWTDDDIRSEEPRWVNNGTDSVHQKDGYTLMKNEIKITFVKSPEEGEICAVFVNEFWDRSKTKLTSYMHIGQHAGCSPDILKNWPLATEQEYRSLLEELNTIGYENIKIIQSRIH